MLNFTRMMAAVALATAWQMPVTNAQAQQPAQERLAQERLAQERLAQESATPDAASVPDEKLDKAAVAMERVASLKQGYMEKMVAAPEADRERIADEAQTELSRAVTEQGLSVEEYSNILKVAENDTAVREKIIQRLRTAKE
jgi:hypothetical protein